MAAVLERLGAARVIVISRSGQDNYGNIQKHADAQIIANTTPVGMYPNNGQAAVDLRVFPHCEGVLDVVYNPARTALLLQAEELGIPRAGGLYMLVAQAKRSSEIFTGSSIPDSEIERIEHILSAQMQNIVLIGMPSSGKSTVAAALGERLGRPVYEADALIEEEAGMDIPRHLCRPRGGPLPGTGDRGTEKAGGPVRGSDIHRRRLRHPGGELRPPAPKRPHRLAAAGYGQAGEDRPARVPEKRPSRALRQAGAHVRPLRRREGG